MVPLDRPLLWLRLVLLPRSHLLLRQGPLRQRVLLGQPPLSLRRSLWYPRVPLLRLVLMGRPHRSLQRGLWRRRALWLRMVLRDRPPLSLRRSLWYRWVPLLRLVPCRSNGACGAGGSCCPGWSCWTDRPCRSNRACGACGPCCSRTSWLAWNALRSCGAWCSEPAACTCLGREDGKGHLLFTLERHVSTIPPDMTAQLCSVSHLRYALCLVFAHIHFIFAAFF